MMRTKMEAGGCNYAVNSPMFLDSFQDLSITPSPHTRLVTFLTRKTGGVLLVWAKIPSSDSLSNTHATILRLFVNSQS